jgi:hypothetical protein
VTAVATVFKITRGLGTHVYVCRHCGARFEVTPVGLRDLTPAERDLIYAHVALHEMLGA